MVALLVVLVVIIALAVELYLARRGNVVEPKLANAFAAMSMPRPPDSVFLTPGHTWVRMTTEGSVQVGIDDLLAQAVGDIESVWVPQPGTQVRKGEPLMKLRVRGRDITVASPGDGVVETFNDRAASAPWLIALDPYKSGWVVSLVPRDYEATITPLRMGATAVSYLRNEMARLAEFVTAQTQIAGAPVLADGALPSRGAAAELDDAAWTRFQDQFTTARS